MSEITIRMIDRGAMGREIQIDLASDPDATPHEHETEHKRVIDALMGNGTIKGTDTITVTRGGAPVGRVAQDAPAAPTKQTQHA